MELGCCLVGGMLKTCPRVESLETYSKEGIGRRDLEHAVG